MASAEKGILKREQLQELEKIIASIKFGSVTLIIQDGVLLQIEKKRKDKVKIKN